MSDFTKTRRLLTKQDYEHVFAGAQKIVAGSLILLYRKNSYSHARLGLALSKRMIAKAHDRNRIKRMIRETFRLHESLPSVDIVVLAKPDIAKVDRAKITTKLSQAWNSLSVIHVN